MIRAGKGKQKYLLVNGPVGLVGEGGGFGDEAGPEVLSQALQGLDAGYLWAKGVGERAIQWGGTMLAQ